MADLMINVRTARLGQRLAPCYVMRGKSPFFLRTVGLLLHFDISHLDSLIPVARGSLSRRQQCSRRCEVAGQRVWRFPPLHPPQGGSLFPRSSCSHSLTLQLSVRRGVERGGKDNAHREGEEKRASSMIWNNRGHSTSNANHTPTSLPVPRSRLGIFMRRGSYRYPRDDRCRSSRES